MATHFSVLAWKRPWTEEPGRLQSVGVSAVSDTTWRLSNNTVTVNTNFSESQENSQQIIEPVKKSKELRELKLLV